MQDKHLLYKFLQYVWNPWNCYFKYRIGWFQHFGRITTRKSPEAKILKSPKSTELANCIVMQLLKHLLYLINIKNTHNKRLQFKEKMKKRVAIQNMIPYNPIIRCDNY